MRLVENVEEAELELIVNLELVDRKKSVLMEKAVKSKPGCSNLVIRFW